MSECWWPHASEWDELMRCAHFDGYVIEDWRGQTGRQIIVHLPDSDTQHRFGAPSNPHIDARWHWAHEWARERQPAP